MTTSIDDIIKKMPPARQKRIRAKADQYIKEYQTLQELRKSMGLTQTDIAGRQGVRQVNISNLEKRSDMLVSTLRSYVESMGCELEIFIKTPDKTQIKIKDLHR